jgi:hypothetical protein
MVFSEAEVRRTCLQVSYRVFENVMNKGDTKMSDSAIETGSVKTITIALAIMVALQTFIPLDIAQAKRGRDNENRSEFYGIVQSRPKNVLDGVWVIGRRTFKADAGTEYDQTEGKLAVGSCAKVHIRNGRVHEIDSEPMRDCR